MRLSEERIGAIAHKIAFELVKKRYIKSSQKLSMVTAWVEKPLLDHLGREDEIDEQVRRQLRSRTSCPPEGSFEYQALFQKTKEVVAKRKGYGL
jgi:hypothetical protein